MNNQDEQFQKHERLIMLAMQPMIKELLLVDVADLIGYLTFDQHNLVTDLVDSAAEQYFAPGFVGYREVGHAEVDWNTTPSIGLQLTLNAPSISFDFVLTLGSDAAAIKLLGVNALSDDSDLDSSLKVLERAIAINSVRMEVN